jgi:putative transposase
LAIRLYAKNVATQKLDYIHGNPMADHWNLVTDPCDYTHSSAKYYEQGVKEFDFRKDLMEEF